MDASSVKRPCSHLLSDAPCQKLGREDLSLGLFFPDRMYSNRENGFHISHDNHRTITDSGISLLVGLWQEEPLLPPSCGQMSACSSLGFMTLPAWLIFSNMEAWALSLTERKRLAEDHCCVKTLQYRLLFIYSVTTRTNYMKDTI